MNDIRTALQMCGWERLCMLRSEHVRCVQLCTGPYCTADQRNSLMQAASHFGKGLAAQKRASRKA
jgi:hypothetical protein